MTADSSTVTASQQSSPPPTRPKIGRKKKPRPDHCLNCQAPAVGKFCAECGQEIKDHSVALGPLLSEGLSELASWDSKLFRTLVPLLFRPGFLTNQYNIGKRVPYLSPLKLYLTVSVLFFLLLSWQNPAAYLKAAPGRLNFSLAPTGLAADPDMQEVRTAQTQAAQTQAAEVQMAASAEEYKAHQNALPPAKRDPAFARAMTVGAFKAKQSPQSFVSALIGDIPKMMFLLLPLFAVSLKLLYWRPKRLYVEHLIFLLHVHAFAFLILTPLLFLHPAWLAGSVAFALAAYVLAAMRVVYKQSWPATLFKSSLLGLGYITLLSLCISGTLLVALWLL